METDENKKEAPQTASAWKDKKGFDFQERVTLKVDTKKAEAYNKRAKKRDLKSKTAKSVDFDANLMKMRKKIRDVYDEEDEEEDGFIFIGHQPMMEAEDDGRLMNGLSEDEKRMVMQKETLETVKMQQMAGKMEAMQLADNLARETLNHGANRKLLNEGIQDALFRPEETQKKIVEKEVSQKLGIRGNLEDGKIIQAARGIKKVQVMGGVKATKDINMKDIVRAGEDKMSDKELAELILEKSGQDHKKYTEKTKKSDRPKSTELKHFKPQVKKNTAEY